MATHEDSFIDDTIDILSRKKSNITRIHEAGDFYSRQYVQSWYDIMRCLPDMDFYAYTKRNDIFTRGMLKNKPGNFTLIWSVDGVHPDSKKVATTRAGYDKVAIIRETRATCPHQTKDNITCMVDCKWCIDDTHDVIEFAKH